jgi:hypothetical protein
MGDGMVSLVNTKKKKRKQKDDKKLFQYLEFAFNPVDDEIFCFFVVFGSK